MLTQIIDKKLHLHEFFIHISFVLLDKIEVSEFFFHSSFFRYLKPKFLVPFLAKIFR
jgi:hypothetical protein